MPAKLFSLWDSPLLNNHSKVPANSNHSKSPQSITSNRISNMRPPLHLTKKHASTGDAAHSKDTPRSRSRDQLAVSAAGAATSKPVRVELIMESPPALMMDSPEQSSGVLISGRLQVTPLVDGVTLDSISMYLECTTSTKRPVHDRCRACASQVTDLYEWNFLTKPTAFPMNKQMQELPFSHLIPGHLPATTHGHIASVDYSLHVRARSAAGEVEYRRDLIIHRALRPGNDKNSMRVFPPTNLTLHVTLPNIIHPIGEFPVLCRMTGIVTPRDDMHLRWRWRKLTWRIEERETAVSPACPAHTNKLGGDGRGLQHEAVRDIAFGEVKSGWKTDLSDGQIEGEFMASVDMSAKPQCGVSASNGFKITHSLIIELIITEEWAPARKPNSATSTGAARVLRTQFALFLTDRAGMGIAWDDEQPPMYEDVPASPPHYRSDVGTSIMEYDGGDLHGDVESLELSR